MLKLKGVSDFYDKYKEDSILKNRILHGFLFKRKQI